MIELVMVRHGETESNKTHTIQGHLDTPLSELGELQAERVGKYLSDQTFHLALSSDLKRAKSTGDAICAQNATLSDLQLLPVLRERSFGDLEGKPVEAIMDALKDKNKCERADWGPPNGESGPTFRMRIEKFISVLGQHCQKLQSTHTTDNADKIPVVLVTTHGGFIKDFNQILVNKYDCQMPCDSGEYGRISPNTGVSRYRMNYSETGVLESAECIQLYYRGHLDGLSTVDPVLYGV